MSPPCALRRGWQGRPFRLLVATSGLVGWVAPADGSWVASPLSICGKSGPLGGAPRSPSVPSGRLPETDRGGGLPWPRRCGPRPRGGAGAPGGGAQSRYGHRRRGASPLPPLEVLNRAANPRDPGVPSPGGGAALGEGPPSPPGAGPAPGESCRSAYALRHRILLAVRRYFDRRGFLEIETPILTKPTPRGARSDFPGAEPSPPGRVLRSSRRAPSSTSSS